MIKSKLDLKRYIEMDAKMYGLNPHKHYWIGKEVWKFLKSLRMYEYYLNVSNNKLMRLYYKMINRKWGIKLGFDIPPNTCGAGLKINHFGNIIINGNARIGENCDIHQGVNIGTDMEGGVPTIGNSVWIGPGAKLFGAIHIADNCAIGANAVVNKDFYEEGITIAGVPAKKISAKGNLYAKHIDRQSND